MAENPQIVKLKETWTKVGDGVSFGNIINQDQSVSIAPDGVPGVGNSGDGTVTNITQGFTSPPLEGVWVLRCTGAGVFSLIDPTPVVVETGLTVDPVLPTDFLAGGMGFTITQGSVAFVSGDELSITVSIAPVTDPVVYQTYRVAGDPAPTDANNNEEIVIFDVNNLAQIAASEEIDIYMKSTGGYAQIRVDIL